MTTDNTFSPNDDATDSANSEFHGSDHAEDLTLEDAYGEGSFLSLPSDVIDVSARPISEASAARYPQQTSPNSAVALSTRRVTTTTLPKSLGKRAFGIANRMAQATTLENLYQVTVTELRKRFQCDRATIYQFQSAAAGGSIIAESVTAGYTPTLGEAISTLTFGASHPQDYQTQPAIAITDASEEAISPHQMQLFQRFQVQSSLSVPVFLAEELWGLLVVQQCESTRNWSESEIGLLYQVSTELTLQLQALTLQQQTQQEIARGETLRSIIRNIRGFTDIYEIYVSTTQRLRKFLKADRVAVFQFTPGSGYTTGEVVVESVNPEFVRAKEIEVEDHCFSDRMAEAYRQGRISAIADIYEEGIADCYIAVLDQFQVRANLVVPLIKENQLWGLFCIHQCSGPRYWQPVEVAFVNRVAGQLDLAMQQAEYLQQVAIKTNALEAAFAKEQLITKMTERLRDTSDVIRSLKPIVQDIRQLVDADRVGLYQFDIDKNYSVGEFVVEDVAVGVRSAMANQIQDHALPRTTLRNTLTAARGWLMTLQNSTWMTVCWICSTSYR